MRPRVRWPAYCSLCFERLDLAAILDALRDGRYLEHQCGRVLVATERNGTGRRGGWKRSGENVNVVDQRG